MNGKYKGYSKTAEKALIAVSVLMILMPAAALEISPLAGLITLGLFLAAFITLLILTECLPCAFSTDEKGFTMKRLFVTKRYEYGDIADIDCKCRNTTRSGRAVMALSVTDKNGTEREFFEISSYYASDLINNPGRYEPQLVRLCGCVKQATAKAATKAKEAAS